MFGYIFLRSPKGLMLPDADIFRTARLMIDAYGSDAELAIANHAVLMFGCDDRTGPLIWAKIW